MEKESTAIGVVEIEQDALSKLDQINAFILGIKEELLPTFFRLEEVLCGLEADSENESEIKENILSAISTLRSILTKRMEKNISLEKSSETFVPKLEFGERSHLLNLRKFFREKLANFCEIAEKIYEINEKIRESVFALSFLPSSSRDRFDSSYLKLSPSLTFLKKYNTALYDKVKKENFDLKELTELPSINDYPEEPYIVESLMIRLNQCILQRLALEGEITDIKAQLAELMSTREETLLKWVK